ncbi:MAG TPA: hypothetical protein VNX67_10735 [Solirubrobacteraceae bacterium]|nr:hypothetical protein [Solirubrobacteraceae bacterium]
MTPLDLRRYRAERLLRKDFARLRAKVLTIVRSRLHAKGIKLDSADLDACYAQAWHGLYATLLSGEEVENPSAWLVLVTFRRAIDEYRASDRAGVLDGEDRRSYPRGSDGSARDFAAELDDRLRLRHLFEGMRATLSKRECEAASLCYLQGLSRAEAAERMGITVSRMGKLMEGTGAGRPGVAGKLNELLDTIKAGGWCEERASLMRAYAFGILDPAGERHALAAAHCRECPACRAQVASLRGLASVLPLPFLSPLGLAGAGSGATAARVAAAGAGAKASSGLSGSFTAKLAVTAVVVLGAGYAVLGRAPGTAPAHHGTAPVAVSNPLAHARTRASDHAHVHVRSSIRRSPQTRAHAARTARSVAQAPAYEFVPERVVSQSSPARTGSSHGGAGEFGLE